MWSRFTTHAICAEGSCCFGKDVHTPSISPSKIAEMPLTVLTDGDIRALLDTLTREDVLSCHKALADALHSYSTAIDPVDSASCASNQPQRIAIKQKDGSSTLFMPSTSDNALGVKVLRIGESSQMSETANDVQSLKLSGTHGSDDSRRSSTRTPAPGSPRSSSPSLAAVRTSDSSPSLNLSPAPSGAGSTHPKLAENIREPLGLLKSSATSPKGCLTLLDPDGSPRALINAAT